jgi:hypothetical protein
MADFFREVDEEVRRDRAIDFWKKYQNYIVALAILAILGAAGWRGWESWRLSKAQTAGAQFEAASQLARENKPDEARAAFETLVQTAPSGYALLAKFRVADELAGKDKAAAVKAFDALAGDPAADELLQDVARLRAAMLRLDDADEAEVDRRLQSIAASGGPFRHSARELMALAALKANNFESAGKWLDMLVVDQQTPPGLRQRAEAWLGLVAASKPAIASAAPAPQTTTKSPESPSAESAPPQTPAPPAEVSAPGSKP